MSEAESTSQKRISVIPPRSFSGHYSIPPENSLSFGKPLHLEGWHQAAETLAKLHPWTIFPPVIKEMLKGQVLFYMHDNPGLSKNDLRKYLWELAAPLLDELKMLVEITEAGDSEASRRITGINLISSETRNRIISVITPASHEAESDKGKQPGFDPDKEAVTSPGTPEAKKSSDKPPTGSINKIRHLL